MSTATQPPAPRVPPLPKNPTLKQAKEWLRAQFEVGADCPCCTQHVKLYKRPLNSSMAYVLALVYRVSSGLDRYHHLPSLIAERVTEPRLAAAARGDFAKLRYWGLLEEQALMESPDGAPPHAGYWKITSRGRQFVEGLIRVPAYVFVYKGELVKRTCNDMIDMKDALGTRFDYDEIMKVAP